MNALTPKTKSNPVPVRFDSTESSFLQEAARATGLPVSELIRRSVKLLRRRRQECAGYAFVVELV